MKKDEGQIEQEEEEEEGKPQAHILSVKEQTDVLIHTQESGGVFCLPCSLTLHATSLCCSFMINTDIHTQKLQADIVGL